MFNNSSRGVQASAGYADYSGLIEPVFSDRVLRRVYTDSLVSDISTREWTGGSLARGNQIRFEKPRKPVIRQLQKNEALTDDTMDIDHVWVNIDRALYTSWKIDKIDKKQIGTKKFDLLKATWKNGFGDGVGEFTSEEIIMKLIVGSHCKNKGNNAGVTSGAYKLGAPSSPYTFVNQINNPNIVSTFVSSLTSVLMEQNYYKPNEMFAIFPIAAREALLTSNLFTNQAGLGTPNTVSPLVKSGFKLPYKTAGGIQIYFSNFLKPMTIDNKTCYYVPFGWKKGVAFVPQIGEEFEMASMLGGNAGSFGMRMAGMTVHGSGSIYPEATGCGLISMQ